MKIILLQDVKAIGKKFDIKEVKEGYARNFLIPKKLAIFASTQEIEKLRREKDRHDVEREKNIARLKIKAEEFKQVVLEFKLKTGEKGEAFGSISKRDIEKKLQTEGFGEVKIELEKPIKHLGEREIEIDLGEGVKASVKLLVT